MLAQTLSQNTAYAQGTTQTGTMVQTSPQPSPEGEGEIPGAFGSFLALKGRSANTVGSYVGDVKVYAAWAAARYGEQFDLAMFNRSDLQLFYQQQTGQVKVSPATWNRRRAALRVFAQWAQGQGLLSYDPTDGLQAVDEVQLAPHWLDGREVGRLDRAMETAIAGARSEAWRVKAIRDRAIVLVMLKAGLREGEVCGLDVDDLVLGERKGKISVRYGKGNKSRAVPVNSQALAALRAWLDCRPRMLHEYANGEKALFLGKGGVRLQARGIQRLVAELGQQAGLADLTPHRLRHSCAKALLDAGVKLTEVAKILGHSRLDTTMRYTTPSEGDLAAAVEKI